MYLHSLNIFLMKNRLQDYYREQRNAFGLHLDKSVTERDEEAIHQMRLSVKRTRALFSFISFLEKDKAGKKGLKKIKKVYKPAGKIRDLQVQQDVIDSYEKRLNISFRSYSDYLTVQEEKSHQELKRAVETFPEESFDKMEIELREILNKYSEEQLIDQAGNIFESKLTEVKQLYGLPTDKDKNLHKIRRILKEARYLLDVFSGIIDEFRGLKVSYERLREIEKALGKWHDQVNAANYLRQFSKQLNEDNEEEKLRYNILKKSISRYKNSLQRRIQLAFKYELQL